MKNNRHINNHTSCFAFLEVSYMKIITFLTDFGSKGGYVAQMKGVVLSITDSKLIDITHDIMPHDIREGAFVLQNSVVYFPVGTVHLAVVDPAVGTNRRGIIVATKSHILVGPDNGLLMPVAHFLGGFTVYEITNNKYMLNSISNTFHGRDVFSPVAAHIVNEVPFEEIGSRIYNFIDMDFGKGKITDRTATGKIIYVDNFGNIVTNIEGAQIRDILDYGSKLMAFIGDKQKEISFVKSYSFVEKGQLLATTGGSNLIEIGLNQGNAARELGIKIDDEIKLLFY